MLRTSNAHSTELIESANSSAETELINSIDEFEKKMLPDDEKYLTEANELLAKAHTLLLSLDKSSDEFVHKYYAFKLGVTFVQFSLKSSDCYKKYQEIKKMCAEISAGVNKRQNHHSVSGLESISMCGCFITLQFYSEFIDESNKKQWLVLISEYKRKMLSECGMKAPSTKGNYFSQLKNRSLENDFKAPSFPTKCSSTIKNGSSKLAQSNESKLSQTSVKQPHGNGLKCDESIKERQVTFSLSDNTSSSQTFKR